MKLKKGDNLSITKIIFFIYFPFIFFNLKVCKSIKDRDDEVLHSVCDDFMIDIQYFLGFHD